MKEITEGMVRNAKGLDYWRLRYERHHVKVPGYGNKREGIQDQEYREKIAFIKPFIDQNMNTLDFGCGIGRYAQLFHPNKYFGYDPVEKAIEIAKDRNVGYNFASNLPENYDQILFCTVLQHIESPINAINNINAKRVILYENTSSNDDKGYIWFKTDQYYKSLISTVMGLGLVYKNSHLIHGEKHTLMVFQ